MAKNRYYLLLLAIILTIFFTSCPLDSGSLRLTIDRMTAVEPLTVSISREGTQFSAETTGVSDDQELSYTWYTNSEIIENETDATVTISDMEPGQYTITVMVESSELGTCGMAQCEWVVEEGIHEQD